MDVSQGVFVPQKWFNSLDEAYEERIHLRLFLSCLDMNYANDGAKTADDVSQNFLSLKPLVLLEWLPSSDQD